MNFAIAILQIVDFLVWNQSAEFGRFFYALCEWTYSEPIYFTITNLSFWLIGYSLEEVCCFITEGTVKINWLNLLASPTFTSEITSIFPLSL